MSEEIVIRVRDLVTRFGPVTIHNGVSFDIRRGEVIGIVGGSGAGKSVLVRTIIMLNNAYSGSIQMFDREVVGIEERDADELRRRFGMMFQGGALFSSLTVGENVALPLKEHTNLPKRLVREIARLKIILSGLHAGDENKYPRQLSGGMLKRAAVARALALDPDLLFLDEPSAGLDPVSAAALDNLILQLRDSLGLTVVMISHDLDSLWRVTDRVAFLGKKRIIGLGSMAELSQSDEPMIRDYFHGPRGKAAIERQQ